MNPEFWKDRRVFITGDTGFKGSWLAFWLQKMGANVYGYSLDPEDENFYDACEVEAKIQSYNKDICDLDSLLDIMDEANPSIVFHLAAQSLVHRSYKDPINTLKTNVIGTANLLEVARTNEHVRSVLVITSDKCYNNQGSPIHKETDELGGDDPYSASKACAEMVVNSYRKSFFSDGRINLATARAGNVIGGGDWAENRLIPDVVRAICNKETIRLRNPDGVRPWQYILDVLSGYIKLAEHLTESVNYSGAWNFGPTEKSPSVRELLSLFLEEWDYENNCWIPNSKKYNESEILRLDASKAHEYLGWHPKLSLKEMIKSTVDWYKAYYNKEDMTQFTNKQIDEYMGL